MEQREDMIRAATRVGVMDRRIERGGIAGKAVKDKGGFACSCADHECLKCPVLPGR